MDRYSVLMSVYEKENPEYLRLSIESILEQTIPPDQVVIVCDGPLTKELDGVLSDCVKQNGDIFTIVRLKENRGLGIALNTGLKECRNDIVARMDSDDIAFADRMERQLAAIREQKVAIVGGAVSEFAGTIDNILAMRVPPQSSEEIRRFARRRNPFNHPAVIYSKAAVMDAGGYKDFPMFEDYYLWIRMLLLGYEGYNIQEPVVYMRSGDAMYERRGGIKYAGWMIKFRWFMLTHGYSGLEDFIVTAGGHLLVSLAPNWLRRWFYGKILRK